MPDDLLGAMVVSCIVPADGAELTDTGVIAYLKKEIASFKVPRRVLFVDEADLSLTGREKIKSASVRDVAANRLKIEPMAS